MQLLIFIGLIIAGGLLGLIIKPKAELVYRVAIGYMILALLISADVWIFYFAGIKNVAVAKMLSFIMSWGGTLEHLIFGYLIGNIAINNNRLREIISATLWGISILTANSFLVATVGKSMNMPFMISFFKQSGYAIWFLYFIMTAEAFGGLGILLHFKLKTGPLAAAGLAIIMLGAVYTHWHNKDPFSDSYAAVGQFINLSLLLILYYFEQRANRTLPTTSIYVV
jgi:putative oxidoreductase